MKKLDHTPDAALFGEFLQEKRKEMGVVGEAPRPRTPGTAVTPVLVAPPPVEDPRVLALRAENADLLAAKKRLETELSRAKDALLEAQASADRFDQERRQADKRVAEVRGRARELEIALAAADKTALWTARGLEKSEVTTALQLLAVEHPQPLFAALMALDQEPLTQLLNDRLALVCKANDCQPPRDTAVLHVPVERCELCGGSDLRAAYRAFAQATVAAKLPSVTFIGGSPAYRETLRLLHRDVKPPFVLDVVAKKRPGEGKRAQATRGLIVIWGGSEVDHDTTIHYRESGDLVLTMNHRGLSGILPRLVAQLQKT